jgi:hypoxanthine-guanine phosphoribosyltransferase
MLGDIGAMKVVMILNGSFVFVVDLGDELQELVMVHCL